MLWCLHASQIIVTLVAEQHYDMDADLVDRQGWGLLIQFSQFVDFPCFQFYRDTVLLVMGVTATAMTLTKYEYASTDLND